MNDQISILLHQYTVAKDLYTHEDKLNWKKFEHLFYVNAGLFAILGFVMDKGKKLDFTSNSLALPVMGLGLLVSLSFGISIWMGTRYMNARKKCMEEIEEKLINEGAVALVHSTSEKKGPGSNPGPFMFEGKLFPII